MLGGRHILGVRSDPLRFCQEGGPPSRHQSTRSDQRYNCDDASRRQNDEGKNALSALNKERYTESWKRERAQRQKKPGRRGETDSELYLRLTIDRKSTRLNSSHPSIS